MPEASDVVEPDMVPVRLRVTFATGPGTGFEQLEIVPEILIGAGVADGAGVGLGLAVGIGVGVGVPGPGDGVGTPTELTAANASTRPYPKVLLGIWLDGIPPHVCALTVTVGFAVFCKTALVVAISRTNCGRADQSNATTPTTCGPAIDVPLKLPKLVSLVRVLERTFTPGADTFGFSRFVG